MFISLISALSWSDSEQAKSSRKLKQKELSLNSTEMRNFVLVSSIKFGVNGRSAVGGWPNYLNKLKSSALSNPNLDTRLRREDDFNFEISLQFVFFSSCFSKWKLQNRCFHFIDWFYISIFIFRSLVRFANKWGFFEW